MTRRIIDKRLGDHRGGRAGPPPGHGFDGFHQGFDVDLLPLGHMDHLGASTVARHPLGTVLFGEETDGGHTLSHCKMEKIGIPGNEKISLPESLGRRLNRRATH